MVSRDYNTIMRLRLCCMRGRDASIAITIQFYSVIAKHATSPVASNLNNGI